MNPSQAVTISLFKKCPITKKSLWLSIDEKRMKEESCQIEGSNTSYHGNPRTRNPLENRWA
jgi:hypothetical protein